MPPTVFRVETFVNPPTILLALARHVCIMSRVFMDVIFLLAQEPAPGGEAGTAQPPQGGPEAAPPPPGSAIGQIFIPLLLMFVVMYFLMLRPQRKQQKEREQMLAALKKNDHVVTTAGIYGIVKQVRPEDPDLVLCIDEDKDVRIRVSKSAVAGVVKSSGAAEAKAESPKS